MPDSNDDKFIVELVKCSRCGNAFMIRKGEKSLTELVCENCIKLEKRKQLLSTSIRENRKIIESDIKDFKNNLRLAKSQQIKQIYFEKIKKKSEDLSRSIDLLKKISETNDEKYIEEYKELFEKMKEG